MPIDPLQLESLDVMAATQEFTKFPELPKELRLKIWENASRVPRHIERLYDAICWKVDNFCPPPAVLQACRESREVGLKFYVLTTFDTPEQRPKIYLNELDDNVYTFFDQDMS